MRPVPRASLFFSRSGILGAVKTVELRRNSQWNKASAGLSDAGLRLVEAGREHLGGAYHAYYASPSRRCRATLRALGFATYLEDKHFGRLPKWFYRFRTGLSPKGSAGVPFLEAYLSDTEARERLLAHGASVLDRVRRAARRVPDGGRALVMTHLLTIELAAMMARGDENPAAIGAEIRPLEGVALELDSEDRVVAVRPLRLPDDLFAALDTSAPPDEPPPVPTS